MTANLFEILTARTAAQYKENEYPVLFEQTRLWQTEKPLAGLRILDATPVFENTLAKHAALLAAGAELIVGIDDVMPRNEDTVAFLRSAGATVVKPHEAPASLDLVLDCAGAFSNCEPAVGFVELTRSGVDKYEKSSKPVFVADAGRIKRIETCLGTGESYFRAMTQLGYGNLAGKTLVVFGSGKVGTGLITYAKQKGCRVVCVTRPADISDRLRELCDGVLDASDAHAIAQAVTDAYAVVTATGVPGAATSACPAEVFNKSGALLANMGVEDEFGALVPASRVLEAKRPVNFILKDPTLMKYIDATMALHNVGALWLIQNRSAAGLIKPSSQLENELFEICRHKGTITDELKYI